MSFKPWNLPLLATLTFGVGVSAATAQNIPAAQKAIELERYNEARAALRGANSPEANYELGRLYQMRQLPDSAAIFFNKAAGATPFGQVAAGRALLAKGQTSQAEAQFDAAAKATKNKDAKVLTLIAQAYAESDVKDITKALTYVTAAQTANKKDEPTLLVARGDIYLKTDQGGGEAMTSYDRATMANPNYTEAYYKKGALSVRSRNGEAAKQSLEKAIQLDANYAPAYKELAEMYYFAGQYDKALSTFKDFLNKAEVSTNTTAEYASFLFLTKKYQEALPEIDKVLAMEPNNLTMNRLKAYSLYETGNFPAAATAMDAYMKLAPANKLITEDYVYQGKILGKVGRNDEAIAVLQKAIAADPTKSADLQNDLAQIYIGKKDYAKAIATYRQKMAATNGGDLADQIRLAIALSSNKQYTQADSVYNIVLTAKPTYAAGHLLRAQNSFRMDPDSKQGLAKPHYEKYIELSKAEGADPAKFRSGVIEANNYLGYYNLQKGDKSTALPYYQQVLALDPTNKNASDAVKIIQAKPAGAKAPVKAPAKKK